MRTSPLVVGIAAAATVAFAFPIVATVGTTEIPGRDAYKPVSSFVDTTALGTIESEYDTSRKNAMDPLVALELGAVTDMQFQRRPIEKYVDGEPVLDAAGNVVEVEADLAFVAQSNIDGPEHGFTIVDVTDPAAPVELASQTCGGFHNDIAVWKNYVILGYDLQFVSATCDELENLPADQVPDGAGVYVWDVADVRDPELVAFFNAEGEGGLNLLRDGTHNLSVHPDGLVYFATASFDSDDPGFGYLDLRPEDPADWSQNVFSMRDISPSAVDGCHDMGFSFEGDTPYLVCPAIGSTLLWDITDPTAPEEVAVVINPGINIHHGGRFTPDGSTMVLGDELAGAGGSSYASDPTGFGLYDLGPGGTAGKAGAPVGALFTYVLNDAAPSAPVLTGYASASENPVDGPVNSGVVTSHFYNFIPNAEGRTKVVTGWYSSGMVVHDLTPLVDLPIGGQGLGAAPEIAHIEPTEAQMWNAYAYRGHIYGGSYTGNTGLFVSTLDGYTDTDDALLAPYCNDVGIVWGPWTDDWRSECTPGTPAE